MNELRQNHFKTNILEIIHLMHWSQNYLWIILSNKVTSLFLIYYFGRYDLVRKLSKVFVLYNVDVPSRYDLSSLWLYKFAQNYQAEKAISYLDLRPAFANLKRKTAWQEKLPFNISKMRREYRRTFVMICHNHSKDYFLTFFTFYTNGMLKII